MKLTEHLKKAALTCAICRTLLVTYVIVRLEGSDAYVHPRCAKRAGK